MGYVKCIKYNRTRVNGYLFNDGDWQCGDGVFNVKKNW